MGSCAPCCCFGLLRTLRPSLQPARCVHECKTPLCRLYAAAAADVLPGAAVVTVDDALKTAGADVEFDPSGCAHDGPPPSSGCRNLSGAAPPLPDRPLEHSPVAWRALVFFALNGGDASILTKITYGMATCTQVRIPICSALLFF